MLKKTHPEGSAGLSLLPLVDEENGDSTDLAAVPQQQQPGGGPQQQHMATGRLLQQEASNLAAQILRSSDIADLVKDLGYGCTASVDLFRKALQVRYAFCVDQCMGGMGLLVNCLAALFPQQINLAQPNTNTTHSNHRRPMSPWMSGRPRCCSAWWP